MRNVTGKDVTSWVMPMILQGSTEGFTVRKPVYQNLARPDQVFKSLPRHKFAAKCLPSTQVRKWMSKWHVT